MLTFSASYLFFIFLGLIVAYIYPMWRNECRSYPSYRLIYQSALKDYTLGDSSISFCELMEAFIPIILAVINIGLGGLLLVILSYVSVVGIISATLHGLGFI